MLGFVLKTIRVAYASSYSGFLYFLFVWSLSLFHEVVNLSLVSPLIFKVIVCSAGFTIVLRCAPLSRGKHLPANLKKKLRWIFAYVVQF